MVPETLFTVLICGLVSCGSDSTGEWGRPDAPIQFPDLAIDNAPTDHGGGGFDAESADSGPVDLPQPETADPGLNDPGSEDLNVVDEATADFGLDLLDAQNGQDSQDGQSNQDPGVVDAGCDIDDQCPKGYFCESHECVPCEMDTKCGPDCLACDAPLFCKNGKCVECFITECGEGTWCDGGFCKPCTDDDPGHCGADCEPCLGKFPACVQGECVCSGDSCGAGKVCLDGDCAACDLDDHCGTDCVKCESPTAHCLGGDHCVQCVVDGDCDGALVCDAGGSCVECVVNEDCAGGLFCDKGTCTDVCNSAEGCLTDEAPDGKKCAKAKVIGRKAALAGYVHNGDTTNDGNNDDLSFPLFQDKTECWDADADNFFRIYLYKGEALSATVIPDSQVDSMMKVYHGIGCKAGGDAYDCIENGDRGDPDVLADWPAPADGWYTIVVDGRRSMDDDYGPYTLQVSISCNDEHCCCGL